ncbi:tetratricopeptide repeat protein, partial [Terrabacter sp. NPDC080008]|uniref:tetratricopeptide repeat protein n=1 Tax=Terrabacter sp. NPDC080008 TaxID=3155176 RepID=UPI00344F4EBD
GSRDDRGGYRSDDRRSGSRDDRGGYRSDDRRSGSRDDRGGYRSDDRRSGSRDDRGGYRSDDRRSGSRDDRGGYRSDDRRSADGYRSDERRGSGEQRGPRRFDDRPRGGTGRNQDEERRGGPRLTPKSPRKPEPAIREGVTGHEVDRAVKNQLRTLSKENAEGVAQHLVMVAELLDVEPEAALAHAETAVRRAGRVPAAREALGLVAYRLGDWARALGEFRTVRRLSGSSHLLPLMVDCERALGRHDKALELAQSEEAGNLAIDDKVEMAIVVSGIRRDLGQLDAAAAGLNDLVRRINPNRPSAARLFYAYADAKLAAGDPEAARDWFSRAADADHDLTTDAAERLEELDGVDVTDLLGDEADGPDAPNGGEIETAPGR